MLKHSNNGVVTALLSGVSRLMHTLGDDVSTITLLPSVLAMLRNPMRASSLGAVVVGQLLDLVHACPSGYYPEVMELLPRLLPATLAPPSTDGTPPASPSAALASALGGGGGGGGGVGLGMSQPEVPGQHALFRKVSSGRLRMSGAGAACTPCGIPASQCGVWRMRR